jgi:hypothetical protein
MRSTVTVSSQQLDKEDIRVLLQAIRDCEQIHFPKKEIFILADVPEFKEEDLRDILTSIKPPLAGPRIFKFEGKER